MGGNRTHRLGTTDDTLSAPDGYVVVAPPPYILCVHNPSFYGGGALLRHCLCHLLYHCLLLTANSGWYANVPNLVITLVNAIILEHPVLQMRYHPLTLNQFQGGFLHQPRHTPH